MPCKGICIRYRASGRYATGNKRCHQCNLFIKWNGLVCPCCECRLRTRPRHSKFKAKLREQKRVEQAKEAEILYHIMPSS